MSISQILQTLILVVGLGCFVACVIALLDAVRRKFARLSMKIMWVAIIVLTYPVGPFIYLIAKQQDALE